MKPVENNTLLTKASPESRLSVKKEELKKACIEFESLFTAYVLKTIRSTIPRAEAPEQARELYEAMFDEALAREISSSGALGLGEMIYRQLEPLLETELRQKQAEEDTS